MGWDQLRDMMDSGFSIESHTASHAKLSQIRDEMDLLMELVLSREAIQKNLGYRPRYLAYPYGDKNNAVERAAQLAGYTSAVTVRPGYADNQQNPYNLPRMAIWAREGMQGFIANLGPVAMPTAEMGERGQVPPPRWPE